MSYLGCLSTGSDTASAVCWPRRSSRRSSRACRALWYAPFRPLLDPVRATWVLFGQSYAARFSSRISHNYDVLALHLISTCTPAQDVSNFDTVFTAEAPMDSVVEGSQLSKTVQQQFAGFSWDGSNMPVDA